MHRSNSALAALGLAIAIAGCSQQATLTTEPVEGVVTLDGQPVEGAIVTFQPVTEGQGTSAGGRTDASGKYTLTVTTGDGGAGAGTTPGEYMIGVTKNAVEEIGAHDENADSGGDQGVEGDAGESLVPLRYNNPRTSGLTGTVAPGPNTIPITLTAGDAAPATE